MSFTYDADIAVSFAARGTRAVVLRVRTSGAVDRGADIAYLSAFPGEQESLYPPLTYLRPTNNDAPVTTTPNGVEIQVIDVTISR